jgi:hypothetical protein
VAELERPLRGDAIERQRKVNVGIIGKTVEQQAERIGPKGVAAQAVSNHENRR